MANKIGKKDIIFICFLFSVDIAPDDQSYANIATLKTRFVPAPVEQPPRGNCHSSAPGNPLMLHEQQFQQRIFDESSPHHENASSISNSDEFEDEKSWSAPDMSAESPVEGTRNKGAWEVDGERSACGRWKNYGPAIRRVSMGGVLGVFGGYRNKIMKRVETGEFSSAEEDSVGLEDGMGDAKAEVGRRFLSHVCPKR